MTTFFKNLYGYLNSGIYSKPSPKFLLYSDHYYDHHSHCPLSDCVKENKSIIFYYFRHIYLSQIYIQNVIAT